MPLANAKPCRPFSSAATFRSNASRVGILSARVLVPLVLTQPLLHVGRGQIDRRHDGAGERFGALAGVDRAGAKARGEIVIKDARHADTLSCAMRRR